MRGRGWYTMGPDGMTEQGRQGQAWRAHPGGCKATSISPSESWSARDRQRGWQPMWGPRRRHGSGLSELALVRPRHPRPTAVLVGDEENRRSIVHRAVKSANRQQMSRRRSHVTVGGVGPQFLFRWVRLPRQQPHAEANKGREQEDRKLVQTACVSKDDGIQSVTPVDVATRSH